MPEILGVDKVLAKLRVRQLKYGTEADVVVGYTAAYAVWVHENRGAYHAVGRAGFLLDVAREQARNLAALVYYGLKRGRTLGAALLAAGLRLQRVSQKNVPVDTGALRNSAFTRLEKDR